MLFDTHCHLDAAEFTGDRDALLIAARAAGVGAIVVQVALARGARVINQLEAYGMVLLPEFRDWNLPELRDAIDREFFLLSEAHYQRYIAPGFLKDAFGE